MAGTTRGTVVLSSGLKVDLRVVARESYGAALHYFTGSKAHNVAVRKLGVERGFKINEYGIFRVPKGKKGEPAGMDIVVGSVHSHFTLSKARMTKRILRAIEHPLIDLIGHPTERQINEREPFAVDLEEVFHAAKAHDVALELNAQPRRLDLSDIYVHRAKELGVKIAINSDAHSRDQLQLMRYGVDQARRGWLEKKDGVNTLPLKQLQQWLGRKRA